MLRGRLSLRLLWGIREVVGLGEHPPNRPFRLLHDALAGLNAREGQEVECACVVYRANGDAAGEGLGRCECIQGYLFPFIVGPRCASPIGH